MCVREHRNTWANAFNPLNSLKLLMINFRSHLFIRSAVVAVLALCATKMRNNTQRSEEEQTHFTAQFTDWYTQRGFSYDSIRFNSQRHKSYCHIWPYYRCRLYAFECVLYAAGEPQPHRKETKTRGFISNFTLVKPILNSVKLESGDSFLL